MRGVTPSALVDYLVVHGDQEARRELEAHEHTGIRQAAWRALVREEPERALARYERVVAEGSNPDLTRSVLHAMAWNRVPGAVDVLEQLLRDVAAGKRLPEGVTLDTVMQYYVHPMPPSEFERAIGFLRDLGSLRLGIRFLDVLPDLHARGRDLTVFQPMAATMGSTLLRLHAKASKTPEEDRVWRILIRSMAWTAPPTLSQANLEAVEKAAEGLQGEERHRLENTAKSVRRALEERPWR